VIKLTDSRIHICYNVLDIKARNAGTTQLASKDWCQSVECLQLEHS